MTSPYLTSREAADYLRYKSVAAFLRAVRSRAVPKLIRGREHLFLPDDLTRCWARPASANERESRRRLRCV